MYIYVYIKANYERFFTHTLAKSPIEDKLEKLLDKNMREKVIKKWKKSRVDFN